jgi:hypothetical protein
MTAYYHNEDMHIIVEIWSAYIWRRYCSLRPRTLRFAIKSWIYHNFVYKLHMRMYRYHIMMLSDLFENNIQKRSTDSDCPFGNFKLFVQMYSTFCDFILTKLCIHCSQWEMYKNTGNTSVFMSKTLFSYHCCFTIHFMSII